MQHSSVARKGKAADRKYYEKNGGNLGGMGGFLPMSGAEWTRYQQSKLANVLFCKALAGKLQANERTKNIKSLAAHPGGAATNLQTASKGMGGASVWFFNKLAQSQDDGAAGIVTCMGDADVESGFLYGPTGMGGLRGEAVKNDLDKENNTKDQAQIDMVWEATAAAIGGWEL